MDKDRIKRTVNRAGGSNKKKLGKASGDKSLEAQNKMDKASGAGRKKFGKAKDASRKG